MALKQLENTEKLEFVPTGLEMKETLISSVSRSVAGGELITELYIIVSRGKDMDDSQIPCNRNGCLTRVEYKGRGSYHAREISHGKLYDDVWYVLVELQSFIGGAK